VCRLGTIREPGAVKRAIQPIARAIAGEHAPRAIRAIRRGSKPDDEQARAAIAEARHGPAPIRRIDETFWRRSCCTFAAAHEPRASRARGDLDGKLAQHFDATIRT
jgi:hypothetical protein